MAVQAGPLCMEPMMGVVYIVEEIQILDEEKKEESEIVSGS